MCLVSVRVFYELHAALHAFFKRTACGEPFDALEFDEIHISVLNLILNLVERTNSVGSGFVTEFVKTKRFCRKFVVVFRESKTTTKMTVI